MRKELQLLNRAMIRTFLWPIVGGMNLRNTWFQQDGATCHTAHDTVALLHEKFEGSVISRNGDVNSAGFFSLRFPLISCLCR